MNLRWLLFDYADPALPISFWKRQKIVWRPIPIWKMPKKLRQGRILCSILIVTPFLPAPYFFDVFGQLLSNFSLWNEILIVSFLFIIVSWVWGCVIYGLTSRPEHYYRIRLEGFDVCLSCGYWLRGLDETIKSCPECGAKREAMPIPSKDAQWIFVGLFETLLIRNMSYRVKTNCELPSLRIRIICQPLDFGPSQFL